MFGMKATYLIISVLFFVVGVYGKDDKVITMPGNTVRATGTCGANLNWVLNSGTLTITGTGYMNNYSGGESPWYSFLLWIKNVVIEEGVLSIGDHAFSNCEILSEVKMPDSLELIGEYAFSYSSIMNVKIGNGVKTIMDYAFYFCAGLKNVSIGRNLTSIGDGVFGLTLLTTIEVEENNRMFSVINGVLFSDNNTVLVQYPIGKADTSYTIPDHVKNIRSLAFYTSSLTNVIIPDSVTTIGSYAFSHSKLEKLKLPNKLETIDDYAFEYCEGLICVVIPEGVQSIGSQAFGSCINLTYLTIPGNVNYIASNAFEGCSKLKSVFYQGNTPISSCTAFQSFTSLTDVCTPPGYTSNTFCGTNVKSTSATCQTYQSFFSPCTKGSCVDGVVVETRWDSAWEQQTNECEEYHCDEQNQPVSWWKCNTSENVRHVCVNGQCITENNAMNDDGWTVELEMNNLTWNITNELEIMETLNNVTGIKEMKIGTEIDDKGNVIRIIIYVQDESMANIIAEIVKNQEYEVFRKTKNVSVKCKENLLSNGYRTMIKDVFMLLFIMMIIPISISLI